VVGHRDTRGQARADKIEQLADAPASARPNFLSIVRDDAFDGLALVVQVAEIIGGLLVWCSEHFEVVPG
jgi:hypothetical protein